MKETVVGAETQGQETACLRTWLGQGLCCGSSRMQSGR